jgi:hypothetical protein
LVIGKLLPLCLSAAFLGTRSQFTGNESGTVIEHASCQAPLTCLNFPVHHGSAHRTQIQCPATTDLLLSHSSTAPQFLTVPRWTATHMRLQRRAQSREYLDPSPIKDPAILSQSSLEHISSVVQALSNQYVLEALCRCHLGAHRTQPSIDISFRETNH